MCCEEENASEKLILCFDVGENDSCYDMSIRSALEEAENEMILLQETMDSINALKSNCDKLDYILSACSGVFCGIIDIIFIGKPGASPVGKITDKWFADRVGDFAKLCGWTESEKSADPVVSAIRFLERKFKVPYDQRGCDAVVGSVFGINPVNHHFKSLAHNPTLMGLFFSILDQFCNTSHFVTSGDLISLERADDSFILIGNNVSSKIFCAFVNWIGHIISDTTGASCSKGRGMGLPSPFWAWINDLIVIRRKLNITKTQFDNSINELAFNVFKEGFDMRFQAAQVIPVVINELLVRFIYSFRRLFKYLINNESRQYCFFEIWKTCEPVTTPSVKRMLTVAHGTFCLLDLGDAAIRGGIMGGGSFNVTEFCLRVNIAGMGRFMISLYGEMKRGIQYSRQYRYYYKETNRNRTILEDYIEGLQLLAERYNDNELLIFIESCRNSSAYRDVFEKTVLLAEVRNVPDELILKNKKDIDNYFMRG